MTDQRTFITNITKALGLSATQQRSPQAFPELFASRDQQPFLDRIDARGRKEREELADILFEAAIPLHLQCHRVQSLKEGGEVIAEITGSRQAEFSHRSIVMQHDHPDILALDLAEKLGERGVIVKTTTSGNKEILTDSAAAIAGITAPSCAIADSATMIHCEKPGEPRSTSLLPSIHIALLRLENLVANRDEAYAILSQQPETSILFISGPSKTADIDATLVLGAHGPKEMHCILLDESIPTNTFSKEK